MDSKINKVGIQIDSCSWELISGCEIATILNSTPDRGRLHDRAQQPALSVWLGVVEHLQDVGNLLRIKKKSCGQRGRVWSLTFNVEFRVKGGYCTSAVLTYLTTKKADP